MMSKQRKKKKKSTDDDPDFVPSKSPAICSKVVSRKENDQNLSNVVSLALLFLR